MAEPKTYADYVREDRRLAILTALAAAARYSSSNYLLSRYAASVGHVVSMDVLLGDLAWLGEAGLALHDTANGVTMATITPTGLEVATGAATYPGVSRPLPKG